MASETELKMESKNDLQNGVYIKWKNSFLQTSKRRPKIKNNAPQGSPKRAPKWSRQKE
jgi:hypothetical protein